MEIGGSKPVDISVLEVGGVKFGRGISVQNPH
jgi:hypothetical protein